MRTERSGLADHLDQVLDGTGITADEAPAVAAGAPAGPGADPAVVAALQAGFASAGLGEHLDPALPAQEEAAS